MTHASAMQSRRILAIGVAALVLVLVSVVTALGGIVLVFGVHSTDLLTESEVDSWQDRATVPYGTEVVPEGAEVERVPRILHQTWKDDRLPERWELVSQRCRAMHPDYEYKLWTDASSREFVAEHYPSYLSTYDDYPYAIQRADAIRYFVLHHYGGVYLDLDVGCSRPVDPLLNFDVILPRTHPVGISNDVIFAAPRHPFMESAINSLAACDHSFGTKYATVMFSTGPMFLSAVYGDAARRIEGLRDGVRVLPRRLYGKYAVEGEAPNAFFAHYFASSWHGDDAGLVQFFDHFGMPLLYLAAALATLAAGRLVFLALLSHRQTWLSARRPSALPLICDKTVNPAMTPSRASVDVPSLWFSSSRRAGYELLAPSAGEISTSTSPIPWRSSPSLAPVSLGSPPLPSGKATPTEKAD